MSLVVAQTTETGPLIVSDTRVTFQDQRRSSFKTGTLKTIVVDRKIAVCFAGDVTIGLLCIREFAALLRDKQSLETGIASLSEGAYRAKGAVEFVVATSGPGDRLTRVRFDEIETDLSVAWIGDHSAFQRFQEARQRTVHPIREAIRRQLSPSARLLSVLSDAMQTVIDDTTVDSVDDFCVRVAPENGGFTYLSSMFIHVGRDIIINSGENLISKMAHPTQEGGFAVTIVEPAEPGTPALGLCFPRASLGMIYLPLEFEEAQVFENVSPNNFAIEVFERFGVTMKNPPLMFA